VKYLRNPNEVVSDSCSSVKAVQCVMAKRVVNGQILYVSLLKVKRVKSYGMVLMFWELGMFIHKPKK